MSESAAFQQQVRVASKIGVDPALLLFEADDDKNLVRFAAALVIQNDEDEQARKRKAEQQRKSII
ncbi:hypothetical protein SEA_PIPPA_18 [Arthrobacter phage Pippa]|nr:hypothetical protein SEA_PIPPA_18 [Arthrobacter phage Pippa]